MKNNRALYITLIVVVALFIGALVFIPQLTKKPGEPGDGGGDEPVPTEVDVTKYKLTEIIPANAENGNIGDHIKGSKDAKVILFEYADYQCSACALFSTWVNELVDEYKGQLAVVFRTFPLTSIHSNAIAAASAVEAAGLQGYWKEYGDLVFANQAEWFYDTGNKRTNHFVEYFKTVTNGKGDVDKFKADMAGDAVKAKVNFDRAISESLNLSATPTFFDSDGKEIDFTAEDIEQTKTGIMAFMRKYIDKKLGK